MTAGLNIEAKLWRFTTAGDDEVGGALLTGTVYEECVKSRFDMDQPSRLLLQQGIEIRQTATALVRMTKGRVILEGDEYEIINPSYHPQYGERWLINGVNYPNLHPADRRGFITLSLNRQERSRTAKVQQ